MSITGAGLDAPEILRVARNRAPTVVAPEAATRMRVAHEVVGTIAARGEPVYGVTTGLGARVVETIDGAEGPSTRSARFAAARTQWASRCPRSWSARRWRCG